MRKNALTLSNLKSLKKMKDMRYLRVRNVSYVLLTIFEKHIGRNNAIPRSVLFKQIFGSNDDMGLADELRWEYVRRAMHYLRQNTKCFVGSEYMGTERHYFVLKDEADAQCYIDILNKNIKRMKFMQKKAMKSVKEKWYELDWMTPEIRIELDNMKRTKTLG